MTRVIFGGFLEIFKCLVMNVDEFGKLKGDWQEIELLGIFWKMINQPDPEQWSFRVPSLDGKGERAKSRMNRWTDLDSLAAIAKCRASRSSLLHSSLLSSPRFSPSIFDSLFFPWF